MKKIKQINNKKMTMVVEFDLETEEERNNQKEVSTDLIFIRKWSQQESHQHLEEFFLELMMKKM